MLVTAALYVNMFYAQSPLASSKHPGIHAAAAAAADITTTINIHNIASLLTTIIQGLLQLLLEMLLLSVQKLITSVCCVQAPLRRPRGKAGILPSFTF